jgi:hypothetical protein
MKFVERKPKQDNAPKKIQTKPFYSIAAYPVLNLAMSPPRLIST